jgi:acetyl-CoA C-acetyltransferase
VFLHGLAEGADVNLSEREDLGRSLMAEAVLERVMALAGKTIDDIGLIDLYSCFPCAVASSAEALGLPADGSRDLTLTGGLPYFGGAGNNYGMHALAEAVTQLRESPESCALVASLGGIMSKHAVGIYSCQPSSLDCANADIQLDRDLIPRKAIVAAPEAGVVTSHVVNYKGGEPVQAIVIAETGEGLRFVANSVDSETIAAVLSSKCAGLAISVTPGDNGALHFIVA